MNLWTIESLKSHGIVYHQLLKSNRFDIYIFKSCENTTRYIFRYNSEHAFNKYIEALNGAQYSMSNLEDTDSLHSCSCPESFFCQLRQRRLDIATPPVQRSVATNESAIRGLACVRCVKRLEKDLNHQCYWPQNWKNCTYVAVNSHRCDEVSSID